MQKNWNLNKQNTKIKQILENKMYNIVIKLKNTAIMKLFFIIGPIPEWIFVWRYYKAEDYNFITGVIYKFNNIGLKIEEVVLNGCHYILNFFVDQFGVCRYGDKFEIW